MAVFHGLALSVVTLSSSSLVPESDLNVGGPASPTARGPSPSDEPTAPRSQAITWKSALYKRRDATILESHRYAFNHSRAANHLHSHAFAFVFPSASASYSNTTAIVLRRFHFSDSDSK
jgi:hypothetical protein